MPANSILEFFPGKKLSHGTVKGIVVLFPRGRITGRGETTTQPFVMTMEVAGSSSHEKLPEHVMRPTELGSQNCDAI